MTSDINQTPEAKAFLQRVSDLPAVRPVSLESVLAPSVEDEAQLRRLFAQDRQNERLANPYVGLVSVYDAPESAGIRTTYARAVKNDEDSAAKHIFPLPDNRRRKDGEGCVVESLDEFRKNWAIFTEGSLSQLTDWDNVIAAGGSVLACLLPLSEKDRASRRTIRKYYHSTGYPTSDIDLFIWGLNTEQAEVKINQIYAAVRDSIPWDATCVRTKHAISIHSQYPYRSVQIVLRLYHSPAEVLAGFDVDAGCVAYDGSRVLANPRSLVAMMCQANTIDMTRRSPSYEVRLAKYASRGFEVYVPELRRGEIDPTIFERSLPRITGLARLLVLEKLSKPEARVSYLESRRSLRSSGMRQTNIYSRRMRRRFKNDLKAEEEIAGLDMSSYDVASLHIPYGPGWNAKRIEKLVYLTDLGMNSAFNPKNKDRRLHRHVAFFGTVDECVEDLCGYCPDPKNDEERKLQEEEDKNYIRGRISFIEDDPGRQSMTGSFNPIDVGEWSEQAYLGPTEILFNAIVSKDRAAVKGFIASGNFDVNRRDHVGRTALHVAILSSAQDICADLIAAGARITARLADGRTALHLAAYINPQQIVQALLARSAYNAEKAKEAEEETKAKTESAKEATMDEDEESGRPSSEDDWNSDEDDGKEGASKKDETKPENDAPGDADIPDDNTELPDILDIDAMDWDLKFTPLAYAILGGHLDVVEVLLNAGADPKAATSQNSYGSSIMHPLSFTILNSNDERATQLIERLIQRGASSAQADSSLFSVFHAFVCSGRLALVKKVLEVDHGANSAINIPALDNRGTLTFPIVSAIEKGNSALVALLLIYGAKVILLPEDIQRAKNMIPQNFHHNIYAHNASGSGDKGPHELDYLNAVILPAEAALAKHTYLLQLLMKLGVQVSIPISIYYQNGRYMAESRLTLVDAVEKQILQLNKALQEFATGDASSFLNDENITTEPTTFADFREYTSNKLRKHRLEQSRNAPTVAKTLTSSEKKRALAYFEEMLTLLKISDAKTFAEIYPEGSDEPDRRHRSRAAEPERETRTQYTQLRGRHSYGSQSFVLPHQLDQYDALFQACWEGDDARIEELCLPRKGSKSGKEPIQIAITTNKFTMPTEDGTQYMYGDGEYTPFAAAIIARKWSTARLILTIASAQYRAPEDNIQNQSNYGHVIDLDGGESEGESSAEDEDEDDMEVDDGDTKEPVSLVDLASRKSDIQCGVSPGALVSTQISSRFARNGEVLGYANIVLQACRDGDLEAFVNVCDMTKNIPDPQEPDLECLRSAMSSDSVDIVDEIIRRTGVGVDLERLAETGDEIQAPGTKLESKLYLGLTVHGKKRKDLATYAESNPSSRNSSQIPLLWFAIHSACSEVIGYLIGPAVAAAYRFYATTQATERAELMRKNENFDQRLPSLLGVSPNGRRETALTAALLGPSKKDRLGMVKKVVALIPTQAKAFLHTSLALSGWNPLHLAVIEDLDEDVLEYLLSSGLSPESRDRSGMNIFHLACSLNRPKIMSYFLKKFPEDVTSRLLLQTTYKDEETPLMTAARRARLSMVILILNSNIQAVKVTLTMRNAFGSMPLHAAVRNGYPRISSALLAASDNLDILHIENGVGETPLETATIKWLIAACTDRYQGKIKHGYQNGEGLPTFPGGKTVLTAPGPPDADIIAKEINNLQAIKTNLAERGKLLTNKKLDDALDDFLVYLDEKRTATQEIESMEDTKRDDSSDTSNSQETYNVIFAAVQRSTGSRCLVRLHDVQRSVLNSLSEAQRKNKQDKLKQYYSERAHLRQFKKGKEIPDETHREAVEMHLQWSGVLGWSSSCRVSAAEGSYC